MLTKYKVGDVIQFGNQWLILLNLSDFPNITIDSNERLYVGYYNPITEKFPLETYKILFNIFDIKKRIEEDGH